jgi:hypothetical protein
MLNFAVRNSRIASLLRLRAKELNRHDAELVCRSVDRSSVDVEHDCAERSGANAIAASGAVACTVTCTFGSTGAVRTVSAKLFAGIFGGSQCAGDAWQ